MFLKVFISKITRTGLLTSLLLLTPLALGASEQVEKQYWENAMAVARANSCQVPGTIIDREIVKDPKGNTVQTTLTRYKIFVDGKGQLDASLASRKENGKDAAAGFLKEFKAFKPELLTLVKDQSLFSREFQPHVKLTSMEKEDEHAVYRFSADLDGMIFKGVAKVNMDRGQAVYTRLTHPGFKDDDLVISEFQEETRYRVTKGIWHPLLVTQTMEIETSGFFTSFKGRAVETTELSDFFCHESD